jgi:hypothetical protein
VLVGGHRDLPTGGHSCVIGGDHGERSVVFADDDQFRRSGTQAGVRRSPEFSHPSDAV